MKINRGVASLTALCFGGGLLAFIAVMPFYSAIGTSAHNAARWAQVPLFLLATVFLLAGDRTRWMRTSLLKLGLLSLLMLASAIHAHHPEAALRELSLTASLLCLTLAIVALQELVDTEKTLVALISSWLVYELFFLLAWSASALNGGVGNFWLMVPGFDNPRFLNHAQTPALPLLIGIAADRNNAPRLRRLGWIAATLGIAILVGLASRASSVALVISALAVASLFRCPGRAYLKGALISLAAALAFYVCIFHALPLALDAAVMTAQHTKSDMVSDHSRLFLWKIALDQLMSSPWLGVGPMHFAEYVNLRGAHPHNIYIQLMAEYGLPTSFLLFSWLAFLIWKGIRQRQAAADALRVMDVAAVAAVLALAIDGFFSGNFVMPVSQVWICIAIALFAKGPTGIPISSPVSQPLPRVVQRSLLLVLLAIQIAAAYPILREYQMPRPTLGERPPSPDSEPNNPRFWLDGWI